MKNITLLILSLILITSCVNVNNAEKVVETNSVIGYDMSDDDKKRDLIPGSLSNIIVWEKYIKAHNEVDLEQIKSLDSDSITIRGPRGELIKGIDAHIEFLTTWFEANSPKWKIKYAIANDLSTDENERREWVTVGHDITLQVEGNQVNAAQIIDVRISGGKIQEFLVYERAKGEDE